MNQSPPTVIVGAGFAGLFTALHLRRQNSTHTIQVIDAGDRFVFKPLLYELLTSELPEDTVCPSYRELLQGRNIAFTQNQVTGINLHQRQIQLASGECHSYGHLVLTVGSTQSYMGVEGAKDHAFAFRTREDALRLREHLRDCLLRASQTSEDGERRSLLTFAVVGAGPAGVEMATTLADLLPRWYVAMGGQKADIRIVLIHHGAEILQDDINSHLKSIALQALQTRTAPIEILLNTGVMAVHSNYLEHRSGEKDSQTLSTCTTIWTAGIAVHPLIQHLKSQIPPEHQTPHGLPIVTSTLQLMDFPEVFMAGDCAVMSDRPQPALAQVAYQQGATIAHNLLALHQGKPLRSAEVSLRGTLMKLGLENGIANLFEKIQINGKVGNLIRNITYLEMLPTPKHDLKVTTEWLKEEVFHRDSLYSQSM